MWVFHYMADCIYFGLYDCGSLEFMRINEMHLILLCEIKLCGILHHKEESTTTSFYANIFSLIRQGTTMRVKMCN